MLEQHHAFFEVVHILHLSTYHMSLSANELFVCPFAPCTFPSNQDIRQGGATLVSNVEAGNAVGSEAQGGVPHDDEDGEPDETPTTSAPTQNHDHTAPTAGWHHIVFKVIRCSFACWVDDRDRISTLHRRLP